MIINIVLLILIFIVSYQYATKIVEEKLIVKLSKYLALKDEKYHTELIKYYDKNKKVKINRKLNIIHKINILIDRSGIRRGLIVNPITVVLLCFICVIVFYFIALKIFRQTLLSCIISAPTFLLPIIILKIISEYNDEKIEKIIPNFLLQLKNYTQISNDIVYAFKEVETIQPLQTYLNSFLIEVNSGVNFENAIDNLNEKIRIKELENLFNNIKKCYISGGSFVNLINKSYYMISVIQKEKMQRKEETKGARMVLFILIALDLVVYFTYINSNKENYIIMQKSFFGNMILYWNFISMWLLIFLAQKVKEIDE